MGADNLEARVKNIDDRTKRIEQILPTLATKDDLKGFPTKDDPKGFATRDDLKGFPTKDDPKGFATKDDVREEGERTRRHFNAVAERIEASVKGIAEGHEATKAHVNTQLNEVSTTLASHDRRIMKLEADSMKRRR